MGKGEFAIPAAKGQEVLAVAIDRPGAEVLGHQAGEEGNQPILPPGWGAAARIYTMWTPGIDP